MFHDDDVGLTVFARMTNMVNHEEYISLYA
jgi:hypothetical protein